MGIRKGINTYYNILTMKACTVLVELVVLTWKIEINNQLQIISDCIRYLFSYIDNIRKE